MFAVGDPGAAQEGLDQVEEAEMPLLWLKLDVGRQLHLPLDPHLRLLLLLLWWQNSQLALGQVFPSRGGGSRKGGPYDWGPHDWSSQSWSPYPGRGAYSGCPDWSDLSPHNHPGALPEGFPHKFVTHSAPSLRLLIRPF